MSANSNVKPSSIFPVEKIGAPVSVAASGTLKTGWFDAGSIGHWMYLLVLCGVVDGTGAVTWEQSAAADGSNPKALTADEFNTTDGAMHVTTAANDDGTCKTGCGRTDRLDSNNGYRYVQATLTVTGGTGSIFALALLGGPAPYES